jgi:outer membrane protein assembly factor BamA
MLRTVLPCLLAMAVNLEVEASPRALPQIGVIVIEGNAYTHDRVILNELTSAGVEVGAVLDESNLMKAAENLARRGIFDPDEPPTVSVVLGEGSEFHKRILVRVKETRTGVVGIGVGVGSHRSVVWKPIDDGYRKLVSYESVFLFESEIVPRPRSGVWYDK